MLKFRTKNSRYIKLAKVNTEKLMLKREHRTIKIMVHFNLKLHKKNRYYS